LGIGLLLIENELIIQFSTESHICDYIAKILLIYNSFVFSEPAAERPDQLFDTYEQTIELVARPL
jgi:hypothetical protein